MPTTTAASKHVKTTADLQKAIFQTKLTNDPTRAVPTAEFDRFFKLIDSVIDECSPTNIQVCIYHCSVQLTRRL
ncbi:uncharacterized protein BDZ99DRAFT_469542 [Mytilinidion resinicola]|uniref:Uncharacterized protein n=1 Tax=Mytilinidion resinicola TaxID=574789 RepID=A0A6A6Y0J6_9PEZI|nr:uncharacterized protein BDZ99DRAFT_469542 [Mytilinidion resinicola]KAF2801534.1 hypothetical protein BDZ99DRAFT_469542 [Mytilinidion resinicola]